MTRDRDSGRDRGGWKLISGKWGTTSVVASLYFRRTRATTDNEAVANRQSVAESSRGLHGGKKTSVCAIAAKRERERESDGGMRRGGDLGS